MQKEKPTKVYKSSKNKKSAKSEKFDVIKNQISDSWEEFAEIAGFVIRKAKSGSKQHIAILAATCVIAVAVLGGVVWGISGLIGGPGGNPGEVVIDPEADNKYDKDASVIDTSKYASTILQETPDAGQKYISETLFVGDSNTVRSLMYDVTGNTWENVVGAVGIGIQHVASSPFPCVTFTQPADPVDIITAIKWIQPKRVVFTFGTNNSSWTAESFIEEYKNAIEKAYEVYPYFDVIVNAIPPVDRIRDYPNVTMQKIDEFNAALAQMCEEEGYKFLNSAEVLKDEATGFAKKDYTIGDGIHLSKNGFTALFDYIRTHAYETEDRRPALTYCPKRNEIEMPTIIQDPVPIRGGLKVIFTSNDYELGSVSGEVEQYVKYTKTSEAVTAVAKTENGGIFTGWSCEYGGISDPDAETITFTAPQLSEDITTVTITANFKKGDIDKGHVDISKNSLTLKVGETATLTAEATDGHSITWSSSNEKIATVSDGVVKAVSEGTAKITASALDGEISASCTVTVLPDESAILEKIAIQTKENAKEVNVGESLELKIVTTPEKAQLGTVEWTSSDPTVATVAKNGATNKVVALKAGKTVIKASTNNGKLNDEIEITVIDPAEALKLKSITVKPVTVEKGKTVTVKVICDPEGAKVESKKYATSDTNIATINKDGVIKGINPGTATITVTFDGIVGTTTVTVKPAAAPTATPTATPTAKPTATPTAKPTATPTAKPTATPTAKPTATPTAKPTQAPTPEPTQAPTPEPTQAPTPEPTQAPTPEPTQAPTPEPTQAPTPEPTQAPTPEPTQAPEMAPPPENPSEQDPPAEGE
ncbi:MAG: Ig-like domain-containing protein [Oscillospiraceae bacterium]|nr:Ig-like domain-containing protein [Oscillospiraceae bacterium]